MIEIYNNFELIGLNPVYSKFTWIRRFSRAGEFRLETNFTPEKFREFAAGNIIYKRNVDEAAIIERRKVIQTINDELMLVVEGRHLSSILDRRIFSLEGEMQLISILDNIINNNFMAAAGTLRTMVPEGFRFIPYTVPPINISAQYRQANAYESIVKLCEENGLGVRMRYNFSTRTHDLMFYQPTQTDVVFAKKFANVIEQNYMDDTERYRNVVYIEDQHIHNNTFFSGMSRREMTIQMPGEGQNFTQSSLDALHENRAIKILSSTINPYSEQFVYLEDWDIGSIVLSRNQELDYSEKEIVSEIVEIYGEEGLSLVVNLGDYIERRR